MSDKERIEQLEKEVIALKDGQLLLMKTLLRMYTDNGEEDRQ
jgi:hypothetical protein